jgi:oligosaccharide repeat unit polymerase
LFPGWNVDVLMVPQLKSANVYGWYSTAWGGMYLDFGVIGALVGILVCGWLAGRVYRRALINGDPGARLLMCYVVAGVIATPLLSIFTISISLLILMSLLVTAWILRPVKSSAAVTPAMNYARG